MPLILLFWVACAIFGTAIAPHDPLAQQLLATNQAPSGAHWFGTDQLGRDVLSRVIVGARTILIIAPLATVVGTVLGTALGLVLGYLGGVVDLLAGRVVEAVLALPAILVIFLFVVALGVSTTTQILVIGFIFTPLIARTVRSAVQVESQLDYLPAARLLGERSGRMMFVEILPNVMPTVLVEFTVRLGYAIFAVATLAFLGFGVQLSTPNWGTDINANYVLLGAGYWWETALPGAGHRVPDHRHQPGGRRDRAGARRMTATEATAIPGPAAGPQAAVQVEHLDVSYRVRGQDRLALRDVSFQIGRNESYGLVGESGSGKSTVALALTRYLPRNGRVSAGSIRIAGRDPLAMDAGRAPPAASPVGIHGLPGAGQGAEPVHSGRAAGGRGL